MSGQRERQQQLYLNFGDDIGELQHVDVYFDVVIYLQMESGEPRCGSEHSIDLDLFLVDASSEQPDETQPRKRTAPEGVFQTSGDLRIRKESGRCKVKVRIRRCSMDMENKQLMLRARVASGANNIQEAWSTPFKVFRHRLVVENEGLDWKEIWYKDVGGKDNVLSVPVSLLDASESLVTNRKVKLAISVVYDGSLLPVPDQSLLKLCMSSGEAELATNKSIVLEKGRAVIKFRIEEVSKNHQNKAFRVKIAPDTRNSPGDFDVSAALTKAVSVRSKINRKRRPDDDTNAIGPSHSASGNSLSAFNSNHVALSSNTISCEAAIEAAVQLQNIATASKTSIDCREALADVAAWVAVALQGLASIEWTLLGNEPKADGTPDTSRPYYVMTNPNEHIASILNRFESLVAPHCPSSSSKSKGTKRKKVNLDSIASAASAASPEFPAFTSRKSLKDAISVAGAGHLADLSAPARRFSDFTDEVLQQSAPDGLSYNKVPKMPTRRYQISNNYLSPPPSTLPLANGGDKRNEIDRHVASSVSEDAVRLVLAKRFVSPGKPVESSPGFPAFDRTSRLVGFYREETAQSSTHIVFLPADHPTAALQPEDWEFASRAYQHEVKSASDCVFDLKNYDNLQRLKEEVAIYFWSKEPFLDSSGTAAHRHDGDIPHP